MNLPGLIKYNFLPESQIQNLVESYYKENHNKPELERIQNAEKMLKQWEQITSTPIVGVFSLYDYWYWIYIYSLDYHINQDGSLYKHSFDIGKEVYIESFQDNSTKQNTILLDTMFEVFQTKGLEFPSGKDSQKTRFLSRQDSDYLLKNTSTEVLESLGFDSTKYQIKYISMEIFLQASKLNLWGKDDIMTHIDGYRLRADGVVSTIFAGHQKYGGVSYFDSFSLDAQFDCLLSRYMIVMFQ